MVFGRQLIFVDADDDILALVHARLTAGSGFLDQALGHAGRDRLGHAAFAFDSPMIFHA